MHLDSYLDRIGFEGPLRVDHDTLIAIHRKHLEKIPYENLDVQLGHRSDTSIEAAYSKIVERGRGGWCYEMNGLVGWALAVIGFPIKRVCGGVARSLRGDSAMGNHLVLITELEGKKLIVDTGFGDGFAEPIPLRAHDFNQRGFDFRLEQIDDRYWRLNNHAHGGAPSFDFTLEPADETLLDSQCQYLQTSEESPFIMAFICQRFVQHGYEVQLGRMARSITPGGIETRLLNSAEEFVDRLQKTFDLDIPEAADIWPRIVERHDIFFGDQNND